MKFGKVAAVAAAAAIVAAALTGCSSASGNSSSSVTLHVLSYAFDKVPNIFDAFTKETGIKVKLEQVASDQYPTILQSRVAAKTDLDLINLRGGSEFNKYAEAKTFASIKDASYLKNVSGGAAENGKYNGTSYGYSIGTYTVGVYYNTDLFKKLGIAVPTNWDEFAKAADTIRAKGNGVAPIAASAGDTWTGQYSYHNAIATFAKENPTFMADLKTGKATWADNTLFVKQLERFSALVKAGDFITGAQSLKYGDAQAAFGSGKAAMWLMGSWGLGGLTASGFTPGSFALPINSAGQPAAVASSLSDNIVGMTSWTKHPKEAAKLLEWMTSKEFGEAFQKGEGVKSTASGVNAPYSPYQKDWDALFPKSIPFPPDLGPTVNGDGPAVVGDILAGTLTPEAAVAKFQALQDADNKTGY